MFTIALQSAAHPTLQGEIFIDVYAQLYHIVRAV